MKSIYLAITALTAFTACNYIMSEYLFDKSVLPRPVHPLAVLMIVLIVDLVGAALCWCYCVRIDPVKYALPVGKLLAGTIGVGFIYILADLCYMSAYGSGGSLALVTTIMSLVPVMASVLKMIIDRTQPSALQCAAFVFGLAAVICISIAEERAQAEQCKIQTSAGCMSAPNRTLVDKEA